MAREFSSRRTVIRGNANASVFNSADLVSWLANPPPSRENAAIVVGYSDNWKKPERYFTGVSEGVKVRYVQNNELVALDLKNVAFAFMFSCARNDYDLERRNIRRMLDQGLDVVFVAHTPHAVRENFLAQYGLRFDRVSKADRAEGVCPELRGLSVRWNPMGCGCIADENAGWQRLIGIGDDPQSALLAVRPCGKGRLFFLANTKDLLGESVDFAWWNRVLRGLGVALRTGQAAENRRSIDPERVRDPDATRATQKALDALFPGWKVSAVEPSTADWAVGYQKDWRGRADVVTTMPIRYEEPCVLSRTVKVTGKHPVLEMEVASHSEYVDFLLTVKINGKVVLGPRVICTPDDAPYERLTVPLSKWTGKNARIEILPLASHSFTAFPNGMQV